MIIGIIIGVIAAIGGIITIIVCCIRKKRKQRKQSKHDLISVQKEFMSTQGSSQIINENDEVFEYESKNEGGSQKVEITFMTTLQRKTKILIEPNKSVIDLIKFYLEKIRKPELFGDPSIRYVKNAVQILS